MSIYSEIAKGSNIGEGINAYARNKYLIGEQNRQNQQEQRRNAFAEQEFGMRKNDYSMQAQQQAAQRLAAMYAGGSDQAAIMREGQAMTEQLKAQGFLPPNETFDESDFQAVVGMVPRIAPEPPKSRTIKAGDSIRTEEWDGQAWRTVGEAPRWNPNSGPAQFNITVNGDEKVPLTSTNESKTQVKVMDAQRALRDLSSVKDAYSDDFLTMWGRAKATAGSLLDKWGSDGELVQFNAERGRFASNVKQFFNQYRKEITGAAASEKELEQLVQSLFSDQLGPQEFKSRFDEFWGKAEANLQANKDALREGVDVSGVKQMEQEPEEVIDWGNL